jgi:hypothetical protein
MILEELETDLTRRHTGGTADSVEVSFTGLEHVIADAPYCILAAKLQNLATGLIVLQNFFSNFNTVPTSTHFNDLNTLIAWNVNFALSRN